MSTEMQAVRRILAHHTNLSAGALHPHLRLESDLDVTPLELVLMAIEIEDTTGVTVPVERLEYVQTVSGLMQFFRSLFRRARRVEGLRRVA